MNICRIRKLVLSHLALLSSRPYVRSGILHAHLVTSVLLLNQPGIDLMLAGAVTPKSVARGSRLATLRGVSNQAIGARIKEKRRSMGMSQEVLGDRAGIHRVTVTRIERGVTVPDLETVRRIAAVLGVATSELTDQTETDVSPSEVLARLENSPWGQTLQLTDEERGWLLELSPGTWFDSIPDPQAIAEFVMARRRLKRVSA